MAKPYVKSKLQSHMAKPYAMSSCKVRWKVKWITLWQSQMQAKALGKPSSTARCKAKFQSQMQSHAVKPYGKVRCIANLITPMAKLYGAIASSRGTAALPSRNPSEGWLESQDQVHHHPMCVSPKPNERLNAKPYTKSNGKAQCKYLPSRNPSEDWLES